MLSSPAWVLVVHVSVVGKLGPIDFFDAANVGGKDGPMGQTTFVVGTAAAATVDGPVEGPIEGPMAGPTTRFRLLS